MTIVTPSPGPRTRSEAGGTVALAFAAIGAWLRRPRLDVQALNRLVKPHDVCILRDTWRVPHAFGRTDADAASGLAYAHAEDDFKTIQGVPTARGG